jgi:hypothetical protein
VQAWTCLIGPELSAIRAVAARHALVPYDLAIKVVLRLDNVAKEHPAVHAGVVRLYAVVMVAGLRYSVVSIGAPPCGPGSGVLHHLRGHFLQPCWASSYARWLYLEANFLQRNAMTLTRMHATGTCLAATMPSLTAPDQVSQTTTNLPYVGGRLDGCEMLLNLS